VQKYERGANRVSASMLVKIAGKLETTVAALVGEDGQAPVEAIIYAQLATPGATELLAASRKSRMASRDAPCSPSPRGWFRPARPARPPDFAGRLSEAAVRPNLAPAGVASAGIARRRRRARRAIVGVAVVKRRLLLMATALAVADVSWPERLASDAPLWSGAAFEPLA